MVVKFPYCQVVDENNILGLIIHCFFFRVQIINARFNNKHESIARMHLLIVEECDRENNDNIFCEGIGSFKIFLL